ncbi:MAG: hypothetical protein SF182_04605 [Deltaproteobacteria bacterium]|nr:hypothetical protein [Deltaproteobacteria bacterium]
MTIESAAGLGPVLGGLLALLFVLAGAVLAGIDPDRSDAYLRDRRVLIGIAATCTLVGALLVLLSAPVIARLP